MTLPNFFIIGAQKAGTTSLYHYLNQHPQIYMSPTKEPHFFDGDADGMTGASRSKIGIEEYRALFEGVSDETAIGEATPSYLHVPGTAERIRDRVPDAKLVAILRDPVERAYSAFLHQVRAGREKRGFAEALREEKRRARDEQADFYRHKGFHYKHRGFYYGRLKRYYELFGEERVAVYLYEDVREDAASVTRSIFRFLEVDDTFVPDTSLRHNTSGVPKSRALFKLLGKPNPLRAAVRALVPEGPRQRLSMSIQGRILDDAPPLPEEIRRELVEEYRGDVTKLEGLIGRDLSAWLR